MAPKAPQPEAMSPLGRLVKTALDERRWSTRDLEAAGGPPASTTGRIINPRVQMKRPPSDDTLEALSRVLQIPEQRLQQAVAEMMSWDITDPMQHEPIRVVAAAMNRLTERQQKAIARIVVSLADELNLADFPNPLANVTPADLTELQQLRNAWLHHGPNDPEIPASAVAAKALSILEQLLTEHAVPSGSYARVVDLKPVTDDNVATERPLERAARKGTPAKLLQQAQDEDQ